MSDAGRRIVVHRVARQGQSPALASSCFRYVLGPEPESDMRRGWAAPWHGPWHGPAGRLLGSIGPMSQRPPLQRARALARAARPHTGPDLVPTHCGQLTGSPRASRLRHASSGCTTAGASKGKLLRSTRPASRTARRCGRGWVRLTISPSLPCPSLRCAPVRILLLCKGNALLQNTSLR